jgi:hypothetical protein
MRTSVVVDLVLAAAIAVAVIKFWRVILFALAAGTLTLALVGLMTVMSAWHSG